MILILTLSPVVAEAAADGGRTGRAVLAPRILRANHPELKLDDVIDWFGTLNFSQILSSLRMNPALQTSQVFCPVWDDPVAKMKQF